MCPWCLGGVGGVATGYALAKLTGSDYDLKDAAVDFALGAAGAGIVSKLDKINDARRAARGLSGGAQALDRAIDANKLHHIFGKASHNLDDVVSAMGSQEAAFRAMQGGVQGLADAGKISGTFRTVVRVGGHDVTVRGRVVDGIAHIGTAFR